MSRHVMLCQVRSDQIKAGKMKIGGARFFSVLPSLCEHSIPLSLFSSLTERRKRPALREKSAFLMSVDAHALFPTEENELMILMRLSQVGTVAEVSTSGTYLCSIKQIPVLKIVLLLLQHK